MAKKSRTIEDYERDHNALELRKEGYTFEDISKRLGYSTRSGSYRAVMRRLQGMDKPAIEELRELEVHRLDAMLNAIWPDIQQGDQGAINTGLRISERRSKMLGLDAPHRIEAKASIDVMSWNQAIKDFINIYRDVYGTDEDDRRDMLLKGIDEMGILRASEMSYNAH